MEKLKMHSPDFTEENIAKLAELFPNCVTEVRTTEGTEGHGKEKKGFGLSESSVVKKAIDFDLLKQELSDHIVEGSQERYHLNWPGKREALFTANAPIAKTLRPCREESVDFDNTENLFIEGDNLDALKLLQETYLGKVKMIYIDPPYNTGKDFIYKDNFAESTEEYLQDSGQKDENGNHLVANTESNGRFHSDWLNMMYPRLKLARNLLKDDGVIFISIDESEYSNLIKLMEEIYGRNTLLCTFVWKTRQASGKQIAYSNISVEHEYILVFSKNIDAKLNGVERDASNYKNPDNDPRGIWAKHPLDVGSTSEERPNCFYTLTDPKTSIQYIANQNRVWAFAPESMRKLIEEGKVIFHPDGKTKPMLKKFFSELKTKTKPISTWLQRGVFDIGFNTEGTKVANVLFENKKLFDYPKPVSLIKLLMMQGLTERDIVLDFFAGSATTAHAVMQLNAEDGGKRKFIMVQLPEACDEKSEAYKAGYKTIAEISKERIRRAGKKITTEYTEGTEGTEGTEKHGKDKMDLFAEASPSVYSVVNPLDTGFRVLKVDSSNRTDVYHTPDAVEQKQLNLLTDNIKACRTAEDLLFQVLLDWGVDLTLPIMREVISSEEEHFDVFFVDGNTLAACFETDGKITEDFCKQLANRQPLRVVFRDSGFAGDSVKINVEQIFKLLSPHTEVRTI